MRTTLDNIGRFFGKNMKQGKTMIVIKKSDSLLSSSQRQPQFGAIQSKVVSTLWYQCYLEIAWKIREHHNTYLLYNIPFQQASLQEIQVDKPCSPGRLI